jgi:adenylate cyclase
MAEEIERKFLVNSQVFKTMGERHYIHQGFLSAEKERVVRIRIMDDDAWITVKGKSEGAARAEFEYEIPMDDARFMLHNLCLHPTIEKYRYKIVHEGFTWEVDEFLGENAGLVVAEIELEEAGQAFTKPDWVGEEVTSDPRYYNASLVRNPYNTWDK